MKTLILISLLIGSSANAQFTWGGSVSESVLSGPANPLQPAPFHFQQVNIQNVQPVYHQTGQSCLPNGSGGYNCTNY